MEKPFQLSFSPAATIPLGYSMEGDRRVTLIEPGDPTVSHLGHLGLPE